MGLTLGDSLLRNDKQLESILNNKVDLDTEQVITGSKILRSNATILDGITLSGNNITPVNSTADTKIGSESNPFNKGYFNNLFINNTEIDEENIAYKNKPNNFTAQNTFNSELVKQQSSGYSGYQVKNTGYTAGNIPTENTGLGRFISYDGSGNSLGYLQTWVSTNGEIRTQITARQATTPGGSTFTQTNLSIIATPSDKYSILNSNFYPDGNNLYSLGKETSKWKNIYLSNTLDFGSNNKLQLDNNGLILSGNASLTLRGNGTNQNGLIIDGTSITPEINGNTDIGSSSYKFKNLYLSGNLINGSYSIPISNIVTLDDAQTLYKKKLTQFTRYIATCNTAANTSAKIATITNDDGNFELVDKTEIAITFTNGGITSTSTLNVNNTGARSIRVQFKALDGNWYQLIPSVMDAGDTLLFRYSSGTTGTGYWYLVENLTRNINLRGSLLAAPMVLKTSSTNQTAWFAHQTLNLSNHYIDKWTDQTITGLKTFQNSIKVGSCTINYNTTNKALDFNF